MANSNLDNRAPGAAFLGGPLNDEVHIEFTRLLGSFIAQFTKLRIYVSGFKGIPAKEKTIFQPSFGYVVATGGSEVLGKEGTSSRIITSPASSRSTTKTFEIGTVVTPLGRNENARRLSIVSAVSVLCLGAGSSGTREIFDFARALDRPILPLPFLMGAARDLWARSSTDLRADFGMERRDIRRWLSVRLPDLNKDSLEGLAREVAFTLVTGVRRRCLVCMPFAEHYEWVFDTIVVPAASAACIDLVRLDLENAVGDISDLFREELEKADFVLALVTGERANVLYEIGFAHAAGREVLLLCQREPRSNQMGGVPFYLRNHRTIWYPERFDDKGIADAQEELCMTFRKVDKRGIVVPFKESG